MRYKEFGEKHSPTAILLHGGGLSWWSWKSVIDQLQKDYHVVTPILDGHGEDGGNTFISITDSASKLITYIDETCAGRVFAIAGLSLGAQIVVETLSMRRDIASYAVIESALVIPIQGMLTLTAPMARMAYGLIRQRWFARLQAGSVGIPEDMFEDYYRDSMRMSKQSLVNMTLSNGTYRLKDTLSESTARALIIAGEKELNIVKRSARMLHDSLAASELFIAPSMKHGELSLRHPDEYVQLVLQTFHPDLPGLRDLESLEKV